MSAPTLPQLNVVSPTEWQRALEQLRAKEKFLTRIQDMLSAERRRLPVVAIDKPYMFDGDTGKASLLDLFAGRRQLIVYHFMYAPERSPCVGCSMMVDNMGHQAHLEARETSRVLISRAPLEKLQAFKQRMGWQLPWYSSYHNDFNHDFGVSSLEGEHFGISVFVRDGEKIYRSYFTSDRGAEALASNWSYLDITPLGRQESWQLAPEGTPQTPPYEWWCYHDSYPGGK